MSHLTNEYAWPISHPPQHNTALLFSIHCYLTHGKFNENFFKVGVRGQPMKTFLLKLVMKAKIK